ncbi:MAG TPA: hypothetical protein VHS09_17530, partial [Polyangiaceae bacterium]|nr:hypothetical protein [Polyangiaceae bacterium]
MRSWLGRASFAACGAAVAVGCGSSGSGSPFELGDSGTSTGDGSGSSGSGSSSGSASSSSGSSSGSLSDSGVADSTTGSSTSSGGSDATLDIAFPDSFFGPDASVGDTGAGQDSTTGEGGGDSCVSCSPAGVTCQGAVASDCSGGCLTITDCSTLTPAQTCANGFGCVVCEPGTGSCNGNTGTACNGSGTGTTTNVCDPQLGETCTAGTGQCGGDCANVGTSYIGCEYYAVTMANAELNQQVFFYSVSVSNTSTSQASIVITGPSYNQTFTLAAGAIQNYQLPWVNTVSCNGGTCNGNLPLSLPVTKTFVASAYHIKSTEPITVYQFNPYNYTIGGSFSYANDASLLIPVNAMTGNYQVAAWPSWHTPGFSGGVATCSTSTSSYQEPGNIAIVATTNGTSVTVASPAAIQAGAGLTA